MARDRKLFVTYASRWGTGRIHWLVYDRLNKRWILSCSDRDSPRGEVIDRDAPDAPHCRLCFPELVE